MKERDVSDSLGGHGSTEGNRLVGSNMQPLETWSASTRTLYF